MPCRPKKMTANHGTTLWWSPISTRMGQQHPLCLPQNAETKMAALKCVQAESFPSEVHALQAHKPVDLNNWLRSLAPTLDPDLGLIKVGDILHKAATLPEDALYPILLAPKHLITKLLIQEFDNSLMNLGLERVWKCWDEMKLLGSQRAPDDEKKTSETMCLM